MRKIALMSLVLASSACAKSQMQVDMTYRVTVETLENTCDDRVAPSSETVLVDVFANGDGSVTFVSGSVNIPGEGYYPGLVVREGEVNHRFILHAVGYDFDHEFDGTLTMEKMDLVMNVARRKPGDGAFQECHEKVRLRGESRPMWDPAVIDGHYRARFENYGKVCPTDNPKAPYEWNVPMDVNPYKEGRAIVGFDEKETNVFFDLEISPDGDVDWTGPMYIIFSNGIATENVAHLTGHITPEHSQFRMEYWFQGQDDGCSYIVDVSGGKVIPSPASIDNAYRVNYLVEDDCKPIVNGIGPHEDEFDMRVETVSQDDGKLNLLEAPWRISLDLDGKTFHNEYLYNWGEAFITYDGVFDPPFLDYSVEWHFWPAQEEYECYRRITASGTARYWLEGDDLPVEESALRIPILRNPERPSFQGTHLNLGEERPPFLLKLN